MNGVQGVQNAITIIEIPSIGKALKYNDLSDIPSKLWSDVFDDIDAFYSSYPWPWFDNSNDAEEIYEMCRYFVDDAKGIYFVDDAKGIQQNPYIKKEFGKSRLD